MSTLILTRKDVARHLEALSLLEALREAFVATGAEQSGPARAVASIGEAAPGLLLQLQDAQTGALLAVMESGHLFGLRSALVSALAADVLARQDAKAVALVGTAERASMLLKSLRLVRSLQQVRVWEPQWAEAELFARQTQQALKVPVGAVRTAEEAVGEADIVVTTAEFVERLLPPGLLRPGTHLTVLGEAPSPPGCPLFCEDGEQAASKGAVAHLGEVLSGRHPGRRTKEEVTVFVAVGLPFQDLAAAWSVYQSARHDEGVLRVDFTA